MRPDGRKNDLLRPVDIQFGFQKYAEGSVLITVGETRVLCAASVSDSVPPFRKGTGEGWVSAEYSLLPRSTHVRTSRERQRIGGRTHEIQRTIGRVLRAAIDLSAISERTIWLDCDVLQADGGTRTASITGAYIALVLATRKLSELGYIKRDPITSRIAAVSVGIVDGEIRLDMDYKEDFAAAVDLNVAMTDNDEFVEIQGTAESKPFDRKQLNSLLDLAGKGIRELHAIQEQALSR